eukprot:UN02675
MYNNHQLTLTDGTNLANCINRIGLSTPVKNIHMAGNNIVVKHTRCTSTNNAQSSSQSSGQSSTHGNDEQCVDAFYYTFLVQAKSPSPKTNEIYRAFIVFMNAVTGAPEGIYPLQYPTLLKDRNDSRYSPNYDPPSTGNPEFYYSHAFWANATPLSLRATHGDTRGTVIQSYYPSTAQFFVNVNVADRFTRIQEVDLHHALNHLYTCDRSSVPKWGDKSW